MSATSAETTGPSDPAVVDRVLDDLVTAIGDESGSLLIDLLGSYLTEATAQVARFAAAARADDRATVAAVAHSLRSASALLGAARLASLLRAAEDVAASGRGDLDGLVAPVRAEYARVEIALERRLAAAG